MSNAYVNVAGSYGKVKTLPTVLAGSETDTLSASLRKYSAGLAHIFGHITFIIFGSAKWISLQGPLVKHSQDP